MKYFDFEKKIQNIDIKIQEIDSSDNLQNSPKLKKYLSDKEDLFKSIYSNLNPWQKVQVARHPNRPHSKDYIENIFDDFISLSGDKKYGEDGAIIGGLGKLDHKSYIVIGNEKGSSMESRIKHNFGMAKPEGYRKAQRLMLLGEKFNFPIVTFVDTAGAFPGKEAEERGQSESIASSISISLKVKTPIISVIIGEGGSGGAIALATADKVLMLENSIYSVISPEGCSSILWRSTDFIQKAAESLKLTSQDCLKFGIIDEVIKEVTGGAHRNHKEQIELVKKHLSKHFLQLEAQSKKDLIENRNQKFLNITKSI